MDNTSQLISYTEPIAVTPIAVTPITVTPIAVTPITSSKSSKSSFFSLDATFARLVRIDFIVVYLSLIILGILLLVVVFYGSDSAWYQSLIKPDINPWIPRVGWVIATVLSYVTFFFIWQDVREYPIPRDLIVSVLFVISSFLFLLWAVLFYYGQDLVTSLWVAIALFIYNLWLFIYVWNISPVGALFLIPNLILYGYLVYSSVDLASLNNASV